MKLADVRRCHHSSTSLAYYHCRLSKVLPSPPAPSCLCRECQWLITRWPSHWHPQLTPTSLH